MLAHKTASGSGILIGVQLGTRAIDFGVLLLLAHLLVPRDFGLVALAMSPVLIVEAAISELPLRAALVRITTLEKAHFDTVFTLSLLRGLAIMVLLWVIAWPLGYSYGDPRLTILICVVSFAPGTRGLASPRLALFLKDMKFWQIGAGDALAKSAAAIVAVTLAFHHGGYWSLAAYTVTTPIMIAATSYVFAPYRPCIGLERWREFFNFAGWMGLAQILSAINWQYERLLLGKLYGDIRLGLFTTADDLSRIPVRSLVTPVFTPLLSAFCRFTGDATALARVYRLSGAAMVTIGLPILVGESLVAGSIVHVFLGTKWASAVVFLRWLSLSLIPTLVAVPFGVLVMAEDCTRLAFRRNLFELCVKIPLVSLGAIKFGFTGVIAARIISETATGLFCLLLARQLIGISIFDQLAPLWRPIASALAMAAVVSAVQTMLMGATHNAEFVLGGTVFAGGTIYLLSVFGLWRFAGKPPGLERLVVERFHRLREQSKVEVGIL